MQRVLLTSSLEIEVASESSWIFLMMQFSDQAGHAQLSSHLGINALRVREELSYHK